MRYDLSPDISVLSFTQISWKFKKTGLVLASMIFTISKTARLRLTAPPTKQTWYGLISKFRTPQNLNPAQGRHFYFSQANNLTQRKWSVFERRIRESLWLSASMNHTHSSTCSFEGCTQGQVYLHFFFLIRSCQSPWCQVLVGMRGDSWDWFSTFCR